MVPICCVFQANLSSFLAWKARIHQNITCSNDIVCEIREDSRKSQTWLHAKNLIFAGNLNYFCPINRKIRGKRTVWENEIEKQNDFLTTLLFVTCLQRLFAGDATTASDTLWIHFWKNHQWRLFQKERLSSTMSRWLGFWNKNLFTQRFNYDKCWLFKNNTFAMIDNSKFFLKCLWNVLIDFLYRSVRKKYLQGVKVKRQKRWNKLVSSRLSRRCWWILFALCQIISFFLYFHLFFYSFFRHFLLISFLSFLILFFFLIHFLLPFHPSNLPPTLIDGHYNARIIHTNALCEKIIFPKSSFLCVALIKV